MMDRLLNGAQALCGWPAFLCRAGADQWAQHRGIYRHASSLRKISGYLSGYCLALSCDHHGGVPYVVYDNNHGGAIDWSGYDNISEGSSVWVRYDDLTEFNARVLPKTDARFVLVTTESDWPVPVSFPEASKQILESGRVLAWFAQNYIGGDDTGLIRGVPIGPMFPRKTDLLYGDDRSIRGCWGLRDMLRIDYLPPDRIESQWRALKNESRPLRMRLPRAFADFHLNNSSRSRRYGESRADIREILRHNPDVGFSTGRMTQDKLFRQYGKHAFVVSPHGGGYDCYRTWEALIMGCIPIVKRSPIDAIFRDLPVVIVDDWREITAPNLQRWLRDHEPAFDGIALRNALSMEYWRNEIRAAGLAAGSAAVSRKLTTRPL